MNASTNQSTPTPDAYWHALESVLPSIPADQQRFAVTLYRALAANGRALNLAEIARAVGLPETLRARGARARTARDVRLSRRGTRRRLRRAGDGADAPRAPRAWANVVDLVRLGQLVHPDAARHACRGRLKLFASRVSGERWAERHAGLALYPLNEAFALGQQLLVRQFGHALPLGAAA